MDPNDDLLSFYAPVTAEALAETSADSRAEFVKPPPGDSYWRLLPRKSGESSTSPWVRRGQHWIRANESANAVGAADCMKLAHGTDVDCPACAYAETLLAVPPSDPSYATCQAIAAEMTPKATFVVAAVMYDAGTLTRTMREDIDPAKAAGSIVLLEVGPGLRRDLDAIANNGLTGGNYFDPRNGFIIHINRSGSGKGNTKYKAAAVKDIRGYAGGSPEAAIAILKALPSLDKACPLPTAADVAADLERCRDKLASGGGGQRNGGQRNAGDAAAEMARNAGAQYR